MKKPEISRKILIEDLVNNYPFSVKYLMDKGIRCIMCGEPIWGTLEEACQEKNFPSDKIDAIVEEMKSLAIEHEGEKYPEKKIDVKKID